MFNLPYDVVAFFQQFPGGNVLTITDPKSGERFNVPGPPTGGNLFLAAAMGDFNQDGYADLALVGNPGSAPGGVLGIVTAWDPNAPLNGVVFGPPLVVQTQFDPLSLPTSFPDNRLSPSKPRWRSAISMETGRQRSPW